jgi:hypothetical protein
MHDLGPDSARPAPPEKPWNPPALPSSADLLSRTAINGVLHPLRAGKVLIPGAIGALRQTHHVPPAAIRKTGFTLAIGWDRADYAISGDNPKPGVCHRGTTALFVHRPWDSKYRKVPQNYRD